MKINESLKYNLVICTSSESGPQTSGPRQYPAINIAIVRDATSVEKEKCSINSSATPDGADEANVLEKK